MTTWNGPEDGALDPAEGSPSSRHEPLGVEACDVLHGRAAEPGVVAAGQHSLDAE